MSAQEYYWLAPILALVMGLLAGLGFLLSRNWALGIALGAWVVQVIGWTTAFAIWPGPHFLEQPNWNIGL